MRAFVLAGALVLTGCASGSFSMRTVPPETPAADNAAAVKKMQALMAANKAARAAAPAESASTPSIAAPTVSRPSTAVTDGSAQPAPAPDAAAAGETPPRPLTVADAPSSQTYDPWERLNRFTYRFNARFDEAIFFPVANGYRRIPSPLRAGVHHFFSNLSEVGSTINYSLQGRLGLGVRSLGRFVINSTIGIGGLFDVATEVNLANPPTGFGTTLAKWGMHPGAFVILPLLGPSTLRESVGLLGDYGASYGVNLAGFYRGDGSYAFGVGNAIDQRANVNFRYYGTGSPFEYDTIRFLYVRKLLIEDEGLHAKSGPRMRDATAPAGQ